jgi:lipid A disaccharide synthetase
MQTPFVMVYWVSSLTYLLGKPRVKGPHLAMVNLIPASKSFRNSCRTILRLRMWSHDCKRSSRTGPREVVCWTAW